MNISYVGSPNYATGRGGKPVSYVVVHHTAGSLAGADAVFQDKQRNTSAHYGVGRNGEIHQYVAEKDTAYHAGNFDVNQRSVGIEHEDLNTDNYTDIEYETSAALIREICSRYNLPINANTIRPHRAFTATACPGTLDLSRLIELANKGGNMPSSQDKVDDLAVRLGYNLALLRQPSDAEIASHSGKKTQEQFDRELLGSAEHREVQRFHELGTKAQEKVTELKPGVYLVK